jgi:hypothetical protein
MAQDPTKDKPATREAKTPSPTTGDKTTTPPPPKPPKPTPAPKKVAKTPEEQIQEKHDDNVLSLLKRHEKLVSNPNENCINPLVQAITIALTNPSYVSVRAIIDHLGTCDVINTMSARRGLHLTSAFNQRLIAVLTSVASKATRKETREIDWDSVRLVLQNKRFDLDTFISHVSSGYK